MIGQNKRARFGRVQIGIYGCTKAGKTRFLFQLLNRWERTRRLLEQSENCQKFLATVESELQKFGNTMPTAATAQNIQVKVRREGNEPPLELVFCDLRGELISEELDQLDQVSSLSRTGVIPDQVKKCDAFLFFFDPTSSERPSDIEAHYQCELKRATKFLEYVFQVRENRHLPIIFVLTHLDVWENNAEIRAKAEKWIEEVHAHLNELYASKLRRLHPKNLVKRSCIAFSVSSLGQSENTDRQIEQVVEQLVELVKESRRYQNRLRKGAIPTLFGALGVLVLFGVVLTLIINSRNSGCVPGGDDRHICQQLDELEGILKNYPPGRLPSIEQAKKINDHLQWLVESRSLDLPSCGGGGPEKTRQRMESALGSIAEIVSKSANSQASPADLVPVLAAYLENLPDLSSISPDLAEVQRRYWELQRKQVINEIATILKRRYAVASSPIDTLGEVISKLQDFEQEVNCCKVFGPEAHKKLVEEIQTARTFCEDRKKSNSYPAKFCVESASYTSDKTVDLPWRCIQLESPGAPPSPYYALTPSRRTETSLSFTTKANSYDITLRLGTPITCTLYIHGSDKWDVLHKFDLTSEQGPLTSLGLPLLEPKQSEITRKLEWEGMKLTLKFSDFPPVPPFLWDAATIAKESKP